MKKNKLVAGIIITSMMISLVGCGKNDKMSSKTNNRKDTQDIYEATNDTDAGYSETGTEEYEAVASDEVVADSAMEAKKESSRVQQNGIAADMSEDCLAYYDYDSCYNYDDYYNNSYYYNNETYKQMEENGFKLVANEPLSTFAADVDTASYANLRRMIEEGYSLNEIPSGAVRVEELINYFSYDLALPKKNEDFGVTTKIGTCPWDENNLLLMVGLQTEEIDLSEAPASNLVFLIDVSGSMEDEDKLPLLQKSFKMLTDNLSSKDRVSIVVYAGSDAVVLEGAKGNEKERIKDALDSLFAGGSTNGSDGINTAYKIAEKYFMKDGNNRVILATDGDLNVGVTSESGLEKLITKKKETGVFLSVLGFGTGNINDVNMETLANKGNGVYAYIDSVYEAKRVLVDQLGSTLFTVAKDVKFQVEFNPNYVNSYRLIGYENRTLAATDFNDDTKDGGEVGSGHKVVALYEVVPSDSKNAIDLKYQDNSAKKETTIKDLFTDNQDGYKEYCTVNIRYKKPNADKSQLSSYPVESKQLNKNINDDFKFAACVASFGMVVNQSNFGTDVTLDDVLDSLDKIDLDTKDKQEFYYLVRQLGKR